MLSGCSGTDSSLSYQGISKTAEERGPAWSRPGHQAPPGFAERTAVCLQGENRVEISTRLLPPAVGVPRESGPWALGRSWWRPWVDGAARLRPRAALRPSLTFQREAAARVVLPRARPHHPGHSSGQRGHPGGSFAWKLYPGEGEMERQARRWRPSETPRSVESPSPKRLESEGGTRGGELLAPSPERGSRRNRGKGRAGRPRVQDREPRAKKFRASLSEWP